MGSFCNGVNDHGVKQAQWPPILPKVRYMYAWVFLSIFFFRFLWNCDLCVCALNIDIIALNLKRMFFFFFNNNKKKLSSWDMLITTKERWTIPLVKRSDIHTFTEANWAVNPFRLFVTQVDKSNLIINVNYHIYNEPFMCTTNIAAIAATSIYIVKFKASQIKKLCVCYYVCVCEKNK